MSVPKFAQGRGGADFGKSRRVRRASEFSSVLARRRVVRGKLVVVYFASNNKTSARLGLIVGRKIDRRAVARNRFKRIVREAFRAMRSQLPPLDIVVRASAPLHSKMSGELKFEIDALLCKLGQ